MKIKRISIYTYLSIQLILFIGFLYFPLFSVENFFFFTQKKNIINILTALYINKELFLFLVLAISTVIIPSLKFLFSILVFIKPHTIIIKNGRFRKRATRNFAFLLRHHMILNYNLLLNNILVNTTCTSVCNTHDIA